MLLGLDDSQSQSLSKAEGGETQGACVGQRTQRWAVGRGGVYQLWQGQVCATYCEVTSAEHGEGWCVPSVEGDPVRVDSYEFVGRWAEHAEWVSVSYNAKKS